MVTGAWKGCSGVVILSMKGVKEWQSKGVVEGEQGR